MVRGNTISYSANKKRKQPSVISGLIKEIKYLEEKVNNSEIPVLRVKEK